MSILEQLLPASTLAEYLREPGRWNARRGELHFAFGLQPFNLAPAISEQNQILEAGPKFSGETACRLKHQASLLPRQSASESPSEAVVNRVVDRVYGVDPEQRLNPAQSRITAMNNKRAIHAWQTDIPGSVQNVKLFGGKLVCGQRLESATWNHDRLRIRKVKEHFTIYGIECAAVQRIPPGKAATRSAPHISVVVPFVVRRWDVRVISFSQITRIHGAQKEMFSWNVIVSQVATF
jgi:hypothetical protein